MFKHLKINPLEWLGYLFAPIQKNGAFFVFMFALGWICTQLEITLHLIGAKPYELSAPELFLDIYVVSVVLTLIPHKVRYWVRALLYVALYSIALVDMFCYVKFESTLTPTMLMLFNETTKQESEEFLASYLNGEVITSYVGWILLLILVHIVWIFLRKQLVKLSNRMILPEVNDLVPMVCKAILGCFTAGLLIDCYNQCWDNKVAMKRLFSYNTVGQVEHELTRKDRAELYIPVYRLIFSIYANHLADHQLVQLEAASEKVQIDSCSYRVPNIVLVIGESYNKHHSQLYGYNMPTTPHQVAMAQEGSLVPFTDVVAPWNLTSFVFKNILSLQAVGDSAEWCDYPLFPEVFRQAGYHVTFITNQFQSKADEAVYDFSGGFFLNNPELSNKLFDTRNTRLYPYDEGVLQEYDRLQKENKEHNLVILHLMGSHLMYKARYPQKTHKFLKDSMYNRPELTKKQRMILADYDNSIRYNDSIVWAVTQRFMDKDAVVIFMPDHAEEIFDGQPYVYGRMHGATIDYRLARNEMEIPFWIWGSPKYQENHPYGWQAIQAAKNRPMMTDVLSHLLLYFGGISSPLYRSEYNVVSPEYNTKRPRILKGETDYNQLKKK
ncbi:phosphoethanolamine transferase [Prevotella sp. P6B1]|uniref:phosphoethanolamine transferase n=1 Tax=Prevotella sp. P6B1 TaxID=1410613 RepID=UPI00051C6C76|nr:phosphoethanolamine transferase [Prevotella sp. P6B1]